MASDEARKSISVKESTYEEFKEWGKYGENMDDVLQRLLRLAKHSRNFYGKTQPELDAIPAATKEGSKL